MKRLIAALAALAVLCASLSLAEDLSSLTDQELMTLYLRAAKELADRGLTGPEYGAADPEMMECLEAFFRCWAGNRQDDMQPFCSKAWREKTENPRVELFGLLGNRTPKSYVVNTVYGEAEDTARTVSVTALIDRNNGKDPVEYLFRIVMRKEEDGIWYVDPESLTNSERLEETPTEAPSPEPAEETPEVTDSTVLYFVPEGGQYYHLDPECRTVHPKYQPVSGTFTFAELEDERYRDLAPCPVCGAPGKPKQPGNSELSDEEYALMTEIADILAAAWANGEPDREAKDALITELTEKYPQAADMIREMVETFH